MGEVWELCRGVVAPNDDVAHIRCGYPRCVLDDAVCTSARPLFFYMKIIIFQQEIITVQSKIIVFQTAHRCPKLFVDRPSTQCARAVVIQPH